MLADILCGVVVAGLFVTEPVLRAPSRRDRPRQRPASRELTMASCEPRKPDETWDEWIRRLALHEARKAPKASPEQLHRVAVLLGRRASPPQLKTCHPLIGG